MMIADLLCTATVSKPREVETKIVIFHFLN
jgi:hypothetical protein